MDRDNSKESYLKSPNSWEENQYKALSCSSEYYNSLASAPNKQKEKPMEIQSKMENHREKNIDFEK